MTSFVADSISVRFGLKSVLSDVYLEAHTGEVVGILGRNGSGKATLFRCLLGLLRSSTGLVRVDGRPIPRKHAPRTFAYLPQESFLPRDLRVIKSIHLILDRAADLSLLEDDSRVNAILQRRAGQLSGGELRYVEGLLALSQRRPVILLDEPFSQLEPIYRQLLAARIREAAEHTVVLVSDHLYWHVQDVSTRIKVLHAGTLRDADNSAISLREHGYVL